MNWWRLIAIGLGGFLLFLVVRQNLDWRSVWKADSATIAKSEAQKDLLADSVSRQRSVLERLQRRLDKVERTAQQAVDRQDGATWQALSRAQQLSPDQQQAQVRQVLIREQLTQPTDTAGVSVVGYTAKEHTALTTVVTLADTIQRWNRVLSEGLSITQDELVRTRTQLADTIRMSDRRKRHLDRGKELAQRPRFPFNGANRAQREHARHPPN